MGWGEIFKTLRVSVLLTVAGAFSQLAQGATVSVSYDVKGAPAVDLIYKGEVIDRDHAFALARVGVDLSKLDPPFTDVWVGGSLDTAQSDESAYPPNGSKVEFESSMSSAQNLFRNRVSFGGKPFQMIFSLNSHAALAKNALLRKLGYPIPEPKYYSNLRVQFSSIEERTKFLDNLSDGTLTARTRWIVDLPEDRPEVTLQDAILEPAQIDVPMYHWGVIPATALKGRRALRALIVPLVLLDIPESVNLYSYEMGKIINNAVLLTHPYAESFSEVSIEDARWIARKISVLSRKELTDVIEAGKYPDDISALLIERLVARRNHLVELFQISEFPRPDMRSFPFSTKTSTGNVHRGKLVDGGSYPGYAARFSYGDPDAPLRKSEVSRYLLIGGIAAGLAAVSSEVSQYMQIHTESDVRKSAQEATFLNAINWAQQHPGAPYAQPLAWWNGPVGGFSVSASRMVVSGAYYGSDAKVQLVDNVGVSASVGYFGTMTGFSSVTNKITMAPSLRANLSVQRNYMHLKPVQDMKTALKVKYTDLWMPHLINHLAKILGDELPVGDSSVASDKKGSSEQQGEDAFQKFLSEFKEGEMLVVTDTVLAGVRGTVDIPIPLLLNPALMQFNPSFGAAANLLPTVMRRTTLLRTETGVQVYLQNAKSIELDLEFNFNWWINVLKVGHMSKHAVGRTKAYLLDKEKDSPEERKRFARSLKGLVRWNDSEVLEEEFKYYELKHDMGISYNKVKFLFLKAYKMQEKHRAVISPPGYPENTRTFYSIREVNNRGIDVYSFFGDILSAASQGSLQAPPPPGPNPANSFLGSAQWRSVMTESELTPGTTTPQVTSIEYHYGGWLLSKESLFRILDKLENRVSGMSLDKKLIRREEFETTTQLQMYEIQSTLLVYEKGISEIMRTLLQPSVSDTIRSLVEVEGRDDLDAWCRAPHQRLYAPSITTHENDHKVVMPCVKPWMKKLFEMREQAFEFEASQEKHSSHAESSPQFMEKRAAFRNKVLKTLEAAIELPKLMRWLKKDGYFFQIKVSGFRKNDENGDTQYVSDTLGTFNSKAGASPFRDFALKYGIMPNEMYANYLNLGY